MEITEIKVIPQDDPTLTLNALIMAEGTFICAIDSIVKASKHSGKASSLAFTEHLTDLFVDFLRAHPMGYIPKTHDVIACNLRLCHQTEFRVWQFSLIAVSRFDELLKPRV